MTGRETRPGGIIAAFINPLEDGTLEFLDRGCLLWDAEGIITYFGAAIPEMDALAHHQVLLRERAIVVPGLIDLHTHLPQYEFASQGAAQLLPWLNQYTYPQEARFADESVAVNQSRNFFTSCLAAGTTTTVAYLAPHAVAAGIAFEEAAEAGIRAYLGPALMDRNVPQTLQTTTASATAMLQNLLAQYHGKNRCQLVVTPRFAISCTDKMLALCGEISRAEKLVLQTHISENSDEITETLRLFPECPSYAAVYEKYGCLHERSLLGHGIHLNSEEIGIIRHNASVLVHCPVSNNFLGSGIMPWKTYHQDGLRTGLGTDVAAGYSLSMFNEARQMAEVSKMRAHFCHEHAQVSIQDAIHQATLGNAKALQRHDLGSFAAGKRADLVVIDDRYCNTLMGTDQNQYNSLPERLMRVVYRSQNEMVRETLIDGRFVFAREK